MDDIIVSCPKCGAEMTISEGMMAFTCVDCGETLFYIKGKVITKSAAKALLKVLIEKRKAQKEAAAREEAALSGIPYAEEVPVPAYSEAPAQEAEPEIQKPALKLVASEYDPEPGLKPQFYAEEKKAEPKYTEKDFDELVKQEEPAPIKKTPAPVPAPVVAPTPAINNPTIDKTNKVEKSKKDKKADAKADKKADKKLHHYSKSGASIAIMLYIFFTAVYGAWIFYVRDLVEPKLSELLIDAFGADLGGYINLGLIIYFFVLIMLAWVCASTSFMSFGCVRKKISTKADIIASAATIINIPNIPLLAITGSNRKKFKKYRRTDRGNKFNIAPGYLATVSVMEILMLAINAHFIYFYVLDIIKLLDSDDILGTVLSLDFVKAYFPVIIIVIVVFVSLSRLLKIMIGGKKMKENNKSAL